MIKIQNPVMLSQRRWDAVRFGEAHPFHLQGLRMEETEPGRQDSGSLGLIPEPSGMIFSRVLGLSFLSVGYLLIEDTGPLVALAHPNQVPRVRAGAGWVTASTDDSENLQ